MKNNNYKRNIIFAMSKILTLRLLLLSYFISVMSNLSYATGSGDIEFDPEENISPELTSQPSEDLFSLSLDQLAKVSVASRYEEPLTAAAAVLTVITAQDIAKYGARHLRDVIDRQVNMQVTGSNFYPHNRISMRGVSQTHLNNNVLLLLNGKVLRDGNTGGVHTDILNFFPVEMIKKIEIIRGPGSVIYGTNAFAGVLNIITYQGEEDFDQLSLQFGSHARQAYFGALSDSNDDYHFSIAAKYLDEDGHTFSDINGEFGTSGDYFTDKRGYQIMAFGEYKQWSFNAYHSDTKSGHVKSLYQFPSSTLGLASSHFDVSYELNINEQWQVDTHATFNDHKLETAISNSRDTTTLSQDLIFESIVHGKLNEELDLLIGVNYEVLRGTIGYQTTNEVEFDTYRMSGFFQGSWSFLPSQQLILGAQINNPEHSSSDISPRFGYLNQLNNNWTIKALYGHAFRSPFGADMFLDSPSLKGNPQLEPETIDTVDFQVLYRDETLEASLSVYQSKHENLHKRVLVGGTPTYQNSGTIDYWGVEFEGKWVLSSNFEAQLNSSYQQNEDELGYDESTYHPDFMVKGGFLYQTDFGMSFGLYDSYFSAPTSMASLDITPSALNEEPDSYHLVTLNMKIDLSSTFELPNINRALLSIYADNLLNEDIYFPSYNRTNVNSLPHHAERTITATLTIAF